MDFSNQLKQLRKSAKINQKELADVLGVDRTAIGKWENGNNYPTVEILDKLATYFKVTTDYLLSRDELPVAKQNAMDFKLLERFNLLNDIGKREALKRVSELSLIPHYCSDKRDMPIAAHTDAEITDEELKLMQQDIDEL